MTHEGLQESSLAYIFLEGHHQDRQGKETQDMAAGFEINEVVSSAELLIGAQANKMLV